MMPTGVPPMVPPECCHVCGGRAFTHTAVLWPELVAEWGISEAETAYIDVQQGTRCQACGANVRSIALAAALMRWSGHAGPLTQFVADPRVSRLRMLELNEAGTLHDILTRMPGHRYGAYPDVDMMRLPYDDASFDVVIHSDTLEHVPDPGLGLRECRRVLAPDGAVVFTVPMIIGRLSRSRAGLPPSHHGAPGAKDPLMRVHTEFGADAWTFLLDAGFSSCEVVPLVFPAGLALIGRR